MPEVPTREEFDELREQVLALQEDVDRLKNPPPEIEPVTVTMTRAQIKAVVASVFFEGHPDSNDDRRSGMEILNKAAGP